MQFRKNLLPLVLAVLGSVFFHAADAQEVRRNEKGEKIIVYPDGSWQYFTNFLTGSGQVNRPGEEGKAENRYPVFEGEVAPMQHPAYALTEEDARKIAIRQAQLAREAALIAEKRAEEAKLQRLKLEEEYEQMQSKGGQDEPTLQQLNARLKLARRTESETSIEVQLARGEVNRSEELIQKGSYLAELAATGTTQSDNEQPAGTDRLDSDFFAGITGLDRGLGGASREIPKGPVTECHFAFEGRDEYTGQLRRDVQKRLLFTHTDDRLRLYLKDKEYMRCEAFMSSLGGGYRFLTLQFTFAYPNAREAYGFIEKGSFLMVKLINGDFITLRSGKMDRGQWNTEQEILTYSVHYPIDRSQISILKRSEVDSVLVFWSSGYEEYEVFEVGFFISQLDCLEK